MRKAKPYNGYLKEHLPEILGGLRSGLSPTEIAKTFAGKWPNTPDVASAIGYIGKLHGIYKPNTAKSKKQRNKELLKAYRKGGVSYRKLAERFGLSLTQVSIGIRKEIREEKRRAEAKSLSLAAKSGIDVPIKVLCLSERVSNGLKWAGIKTIKQAERISDRKLLEQPNFGSNSLKELRSKIAAFHKMER